MQIRTSRHLAECVSIFQQCTRKRPLRLKVFPFKCEPAQITDNQASILATFKLAEPYGTVAMKCERQGDITMIELSTGGNIRGQLTAKSMAKTIAARLET